MVTMRDRQRARRRQAGLTLVELMITIVISSIVASSSAIITSMSVKPDAGVLLLGVICGIIDSWPKQRR